MASLLIKDADWVVTMDPDRRILQGGFVLIDGDRIVRVAKMQDFEPNFDADKVIDGKGKMVMPGLIDTHIHCAQQLGRGLGDEAYSGTERLFKRLWVVEANMDAGDALCAARLAQLELIRAGTTCFADPGNYFPAETAQALKESGLRAMLTRSVLDTGQTTLGKLPDNFVAEPVDQALARAEEMVETYNGSLDGRLKTWFSMRVPVAMSDDLLRKIGKLAEKWDVGIIGHACENRDEILASHLKYGMGDIARLEELGLLGPNMLLLHVGWIDARELLLLQKRDVKVSLAPGASNHSAMNNMTYGKAPEMRELGVTLSLGSDSAMSCNFLDVIRQMYLLAASYHEARFDPKCIRPEHAVEMITINGARSMLWDDEIGSLESGKKADVTILDIMRPEWQPIHNPIFNLLYCAHGGCTDTLIVNGDIVMENRDVKTLNESDLYEEAADRAASLARRSGLDKLIQPIWPVI